MELPETESSRHLDGGHVSRLVQDEFRIRELKIESPDRVLPELFPEGQDLAGGVSLPPEIFPFGF